MISNLEQEVLWGNLTKNHSLKTVLNFTIITLANIFQITTFVDM